MATRKHTRLKSVQRAPEPEQFLPRASAMDNPDAIAAVVKPQQRPGNLFTTVLLVVVSALLGYLALEVGYRVLNYHAIKTRIVAAAFAQFPRVEGGDAIFNKSTGYRFRSNITVERRDGPFPIFWKTNRYGHIARSDYPVEKPAGEFRIGLVGDSMTANITNTIRWGDVLEDTLNASPEWRTAIGNRTTRVINFGLAGIGTVHFANVVDEMVMPFGVDLLIVNVVYPDVARRPFYRGSSAPLGPAEFERAILALSIDKMPWSEVYPEVIAVVMGRWLGLEPRLTFTRAAVLLNEPRHYSDPEEAARLSAESALQIFEQIPELDLVTASALA